MIGVHREKRNAVGLPQAFRGGIDVLARHFGHAGRHEEHRLGRVFLDQLLRRPLQLLLAAERHVVLVHYEGEAAAVQTAELPVDERKALGVIGALLRADHQHHRVFQLAHRERRAEQRAVRSRVCDP